MKIHHRHAILKKCYPHYGVMLYRAELSYIRRLANSLIMIGLLISGMAILVGLSFFFLLVAENMPATSEAVPLVGMYYTVTMIEVSCAFFMTCWVLRFHHQNPTEGEVPKWVKVSYRNKPCSKGLFLEIRFDERLDYVHGQKMGKWEKGS